MKLVIPILLCLLVHQSNGQTRKQISIPHEEHGGLITTYWYTQQYKLDSDLNQEHLIDLTDSFHFRFSSDGVVIDIYSCDGAVFQGTITDYTFADENYGKRKSKGGRNHKWLLIYNTTLIDASDARKVYNEIMKIANVPTDNLIKNWQQGFDEYEYFLETSTPALYKFKNYWTVSAQDSTLIEGKQISAFVNSISEILQLETKSDNFNAQLKPGAYSIDKTRIGYKLTPKSENSGM